jgi:hypothetical protein
MNGEDKAIEAARAAWLANPVDIHYRGELAELGVRVLDAIEMEQIRSDQIRERMRLEQETGAWQCAVGHMFRYEPPPAEPPWCGEQGCDAGGFRWIELNEVTVRDWL